MSAAAAALLDAATPTVVAPADEPKAKTRDETIVLVNSDLKKNKDPTKVEDMIKLHEAIALGELTLTEDEKTKGEKESVETYAPIHCRSRLLFAPAPTHRVGDTQLNRLHHCCMLLPACIGC